MGLERIHTVDDLRDRALGCGVVVLDERGRGIVVGRKVENGKVCWREMRMGGVMGPLHKTIVGWWIKLYDFIFKDYLSMSSTLR